MLSFGFLDFPQYVRNSNMYLFKVGQLHNYFTIEVNTALSLQYTLPL